VNAPQLAAKYRVCEVCQGDACPLGARVLTGDDHAMLANVTGPAVYGYLMQCTTCRHTWVCIAQDPKSWYGVEEGHD
jgi:hypothetical protein